MDKPIYCAHCGNYQKACQKGQREREDDEHLSLNGYVLGNDEKVYCEYCRGFQGSQLLADLPEYAHVKYHRPNCLCPSEKKRKDWQKVNQAIKHRL